MKYLVSFIVPVYNAEKYIAESVLSVLNQTDDSWEMILIDDGSTDRSGDICDEYARKDARIHVIHKENTGQFDSRMQGIFAAKGEYCVGLDADDYIEPDCVEKICLALQNGSYDILAWNIRSFDTSGIRSIESMEKYGEYEGNAFFYYVAKTTNYSFCNKLIRTDLLRNAVYGNIPLNTRHTEDYLLICPALCMASTVYAMDEVLYNYRQTQGSVTHEYTGKRVIDYLDTMKCINEIMAYYGKSQIELKQANEFALFEATGYGLKQAYKMGQISFDEIKEIQNHPMYQSVEKYERFGYTSKDIVIFMKLFRRNQLSLLSLLYGRKTS